MRTGKGMPSRVARATDPTDPARASATRIYKVFQRRARESPQPQQHPRCHNSSRTSRPARMPSRTAAAGHGRRLDDRPLPPLLASFTLLLRGSQLHDRESVTRSAIRPVILPQRTVSEPRLARRRSARIRRSRYAELLAASRSRRRSRSQHGAGRQTGRRSGHATSCAWLPLRWLRHRAGADGAPKRAASRRQREFEQLAVGVSGLAGLRLEHQSQRVDHVLTRFRACPTLADRTGNLFYLRHDPALSTV